MLPCCRARAGLRAPHPTPLAASLPLQWALCGRRFGPTAMVPRPLLEPSAVGCGLLPALATLAFAPPSKRRPPCARSLRSHALHIGVARMTHGQCPGLLPSLLQALSGCRWRPRKCSARCRRASCRRSRWDHAAVARAGAVHMLKYCTCLHAQVPESSVIAAWAGGAVVPGPLPTAWGGCVVALVCCWAALSVA